MKKAKVMLAAIAVLGVLGGAIAVKAKTSSFLTPNVYVSNPSNGNKCDLLINFRTTDPADATATITGQYVADAPLEATCPVVTYSVVADN